MKTNREIAEYTLEALKKRRRPRSVHYHGNVDELNADSGEFSLMRLFNSSLNESVKGREKGHYLGQQNR